MPELMVSLAANLEGNPDLAVGNVLGSNIFNVGLILGISSLFITLPVAAKTLRREWPFLMLVTLVCVYLMHDGVISRAEGGFFVLVLVTFIWSMIKLARREVGSRETAETESAGTPKGGGLTKHGLPAAGLSLYLDFDTEFPAGVFEPKALPESR